METACVKVRLRPRSLEHVREWAAELDRRADEVLAALRDEGVAVESVFLDQTDEGDFLIYYRRARSLKAVAEVSRRSQRAIDGYHEEFKGKTWESRKPLQLLVDFESREESAPS